MNDTTDDIAWHDLRLVGIVMTSNTMVALQFEDTTMLRSELYLSSVSPIIACSAGVFLPVIVSFARQYSMDMEIQLLYDEIGTETADRIVAIGQEFCIARYATLIVPSYGHVVCFLSKSRMQILSKLHDIDT